MRNQYDIIERPLLTEKASALKAESNKVVFAVKKDATKPGIKNAVEKLFDVKVLDVNTSIFRGKNKRVGQYAGRRSNWKKAIVTLAEGTDLDVFGAPNMGAPSDEG